MECIKQSGFNLKALGTFCWGWSGIGRESIFLKGRRDCERMVIQHKSPVVYLVLAISSTTLLSYVIVFLIFYMGALESHGEFFKSILEQQE